MTEEAQAAPDLTVARGETPVSGSVWLKPERPGRANGSPLGRSQIVRAAIDLIDDEGIDALSMRKLAARLSVGVMSLYWHVDRKDDLLELVGDAIFGEMTLPDEPTGNWRADLSLVASETRAVFTRHPWLLRNIGHTSHQGPNFIRHAEFSFGSLTLAGVAPETMIAIVSAVDSYVFGCLVSRPVNANSSPSAHPLAEDDLAAMKHQFECVLARGHYPALTGLMGHFTAWVDDTGLEERNFRFGLACLLDGIAARLAVPPGPEGPDSATARSDRPIHAEAKSD